MKDIKTGYWDKRTDLSGVQFFVKKLFTVGFVKVPSVPEVRLPLVGFVYLTGGEMLVEVDKKPYLCSAGQLLLIPEKMPYSILHFVDATGYDGGFRPEILPDARALSVLRQPVQQAFWFDEAAFVAELFNMMDIAGRKDDKVFIAKGMDLLLSRLDPRPSIHLPEVVSNFLDRVFMDGAPILAACDYAEQYQLSLNYLNRVVKKSTGRTVGSWIDSARVTRAKRLLRDTDGSMIDIAVAVGLDDQSYFARFFKKHTGETPSEFRKSMHELS